jgi:hypothetical protein
MTGRTESRQGLAAPTQRLAAPQRRIRLYDVTAPTRPHEKRDITAGQRGGLDKAGSRSLPGQERGQDGQPKVAAKQRCYLQL